MATTETIAMGDGTTTEFGFSFPYIKTEDVKVELQEYDATQTSGNQIVSRQTVTAFVVPSNNPTVVQFSSIGAATNYQAASGAPLANHAVSGLTIRVRIYRFTDADSVPATFIQGSAIRAQDLNDNFEQNLYIMQERQNTIVSIQTGGIGENVISTNALQDDAVDAFKLRDSVSDDTRRAVTTDHIRDNAVTNAKIAAAIDGTKINPDFGNQTITTTGSFGLGTTSPVRNLHIADAQPIIRLEDSDGTNQYGEVFQAGAGLYLDSRNNTANGQIVFRGNGTGNEYARFNSVGDFGLGTSTPATDIHIKSTKPTVRLEDSNSGTPNTYGEGFYNTNALFFDSRNGTINGAIVFRGIGGGVASEYGRFSSVGNFGLGTNNPARNLHITGTFPSIRFEDSDSGTAGTYGDIIFNTGAIYLDSRNGDSNGGIIFRGIGGGVNSEYGRFDSGGDLGINVTNPTEKLHVGGNILATGSVTADSAGIGVPAPANSKVQVKGDGQQGALSDSGNTDNILRLGSNGNLSGDGGALTFACDALDSNSSVGYAAIKGLVKDGNNNGNGHISFQTRGTSTNTALTERARITQDGAFYTHLIPSITANVTPGIIGCKGRLSLAGTQGTAYANPYNFYWAPPFLQAWVDDINIGNVSLTSDYRTKREITTQTESGIDKVKLLRPVTFKRAAYGDLFIDEDVVREGFIAHEVGEVIPSGCEGEKDAENQIQSLNIDAIVSVLTKALQETISKVEQLEAQVNSLQGN